MGLSRIRSSGKAHISSSEFVINSIIRRGPSEKHGFLIHSSVPHVRDRCGGMVLILRCILCSFLPTSFIFTKKTCLSLGRFLRTAKSAQGRIRFCALILDFDEK